MGRALLLAALFVTGCAEPPPATADQMTNMRVDALVERINELEDRMAAVEARPRASSPFAADPKGLEPAIQ
jgi:hypothetical protein